MLRAEMMGNQTLRREQFPGNVRGGVGGEGGRERREGEEERREGEGRGKGREKGREREIFLPPMLRSQSLLMLK